MRAGFFIFALAGARNFGILYNELNH